MPFLPEERPSSEEADALPHGARGPPSLEEASFVAWEGAFFCKVFELALLTKGDVFQVRQLGKETFLQSGNTGGVDGGRASPIPLDGRHIAQRGQRQTGPLHFVWCLPQR